MATVKSHRSRHLRLADLQCLFCGKLQQACLNNSAGPDKPKPYFPWTHKTTICTAVSSNGNYPFSDQLQYDPQQPLAKEKQNSSDLIQYNQDNLCDDGKSNFHRGDINNASGPENVEGELDNSSCQPKSKYVAKLVNFFETGKRSLTDQVESQTDEPDSSSTAAKPTPLTTNAISGPHGGRKLVPDSDLSNRKNTDSIEDVSEVVLRLKDIENKYERRQRYKSIFTDPPLYQVYNQRVARKESKREARRRQGARQALAKVSPSEFPTGSNSLEFDDTLFEAIDSDEREFGDPISDLNEPPFPNDTTSTDPKVVTNRTKEFDTEELAGAAIDVWRRATATRSTSRSTSSERRKSPPVSDTRTRMRSDESQSPVRSASLSPKSPSPVRPRHHTSSIETKTFAQEIAGTGPNRAMWCNMPQVIASGLSIGLSPLEKKLQEALFEIITSEASYYRSLTVLIDKFYKAPCMTPGNPNAVITITQKHHLFSNILEINETSEDFLSDMEACFREDPMLKNLCEIVYEHTESRFYTYVPYVQNQMYQTRTLCQLLQVPAFAEAVRNIQRLSEVGFLDMNSFLLLPLQRVTRLRLLVATVLNYAPKNTVVYESGLVALAALEKVLAKCEEQKSYMEQKERQMDLCTRLEYKLDAKSVAIDSRRLIKAGELRLITVQRIMGSAFHRKFTSIKRQKAINACLFLFNDLLLIAKKRSNQRLMVDEHCPLPWIRAEVDPQPSDKYIKKYYPAGTLGLKDISDKEDPTTTKDINGHPEEVQLRLRRESDPLRRVPSATNETPDSIVYPFRLIIQGPNNPRAVYNLQAKSLSERERWVDAISPNRYGVAEKLICKVWDCPQVLITRSHSSNEGDEIELKEGDQASVLVTVMDEADQGWHKGMLSDGRQGWFPTSICVEVRDSLMKRENMRNFMLLEEARSAYRIRKAREQHSEFPRWKDVARSKTPNTGDRKNQ